MTRDGHIEHGTCSECGAPLTFGERRVCGACWTRYWNEQLESVPVEQLMTAEQAAMEQVGNELVLIVANLKQQLVLAEQTVAQQEQTIRLQQEHIDALSEDLDQQSRYLGVVCDRLSQEEQLNDALLARNNELAAELMDARKKNGHLVR